MARAGRRPRRERTRARARRRRASCYNPYPPFEILSADQIEAIHHASLRVLAEIGVNFLLPEAREILRQAGAEVDPAGPRVRFDPAFVEERIATAPPQFTLHARNPERNVAIGGNAINFCMVASTPHVSDLERGRLTGNFADYCNLLKLGHSLNICHMIAGYPVEPIDLPPATRHLDALAAMATLCDRTLYGYALGAVRIRDSLEITRIARAGERGAAARRAVDDHGGQRQLAAAVRPADARGHDRDGAPPPAGHRDAVHAGRRDGADHRRRRPGAAERRGARRDRAHPVRRAGRRRWSTAASPRTST